MDRRDFLTLRKKNTQKEQPSFTSIRRIDSGLDPYTGPWTTNEIVHLLKRTMFGAKKTDVDFFRSMSVSQAVDALLTVSPTAPPPPLKDYDNTGFEPSDPDLAVAMGTTWVNTFSPESASNYNRVYSWKKWWVGRMLNQDRNILEKMTLFWHNHFATESNIYTRGSFAYRHNALLRASALGNFKQLVRDVTLDPAMLVYLNGHLNQASAPDENYSRELMELFTIGKDVMPTYSEADVKAGARVLTGWTIDGAVSDDVTFNPSRHDSNSKTFSSFFSGTVIAGRTGATAGDDELDDLLNMIFAKDQIVSEFIVRKIYRYFCYYIIDANTEANVIQPLALMFRNNNWNIKPVLEALFKSEHFFDPLNQGCYIKSPMDHVIGLFREFNLQIPAAYDVSYAHWDFLRHETGLMQQELGDPPGVSGWPAYYQAPQFHEIWINSNTLPKRNIFSDQLIVNGYTRNGVQVIIDPIAFAKTMPDPSDPNLLIEDSLSYLFRVPVAATLKESIKKQILLSNQDLDYYWTNAWNAHISSPGDMAAYQVVYNRLQALYKYFMNLAEYQLA